MTIPLVLLPKTPTTMAARAQSCCISAAGVDDEAFDRCSAWMDKWMAHPDFDMVEFNRLCRVYRLG